MPVPDVVEYLIYRQFAKKIKDAIKALDKVEIGEWVEIEPDLVPYFEEKGFECSEITISNNYTCQLKRIGECRSYCDSCGGKGYFQLDRKATGVRVPLIISHKKILNYYWDIHKLPNPIIGIISDFTTDFSKLLG